MPVRAGLSDGRWWWPPPPTSHRSSTSIGSISKPFATQQEWARPYHQRSIGPFTLVYGHCLVGIAATEELDVAEAERCFREALRVARQSGDTHSHPTRLACGLLGELLYERGDVDEADRLVDESYQLGAEGGVVEMMIARYVIGARIKAVRGDRDAAAERLDDGARVAAVLGLPRLRAHVDNERMRLELPVDARRGRRGRATARRAGRDHGATPRRDRDSPSACPINRVAPCERAQAWVERLEHQRRPRALLQANRLLVAALSAADRTDEAKQTLASIAAQCAERGMVRYLLDGGPRVWRSSRSFATTCTAVGGNPAWHAVPTALSRHVSMAEAHR